MKKRNKKQEANKLVSAIKRLFVRKTTMSTVTIAGPTTFVPDDRDKWYNLYFDERFRSDGNHGTNRKIAHTGNTVVEAAIDTIMWFKKSQPIHKVILDGKKRYKVVGSLGIERSGVFKYSVAQY